VYVGVTKDEVQRSIWTFYEVVTIGMRKLLLLCIIYYHIMTLHASVALA